MTRKHFKEFAAYIAQLEDRVFALKAAEGFASVAKKANPHFNAQKFYDACGLGV
jgi:hypothetical protein